MILIIITLLFISAISKAIQDKLQFHYHKSIFIKLKRQNWWNPELSWKNKWNWFPNSKILTWLIANPLVAITDAWHLFGLIRDFSLFSTIPIISGNWWLFLLYPLYRGVFHVFFTHILIYKK
jgi:hypothetical protein